MKGVLVIHGDFEQLKRCVIEDGEAYYSLSPIWAEDGRAEIAAAVDTVAVALKRALEVA